MNESRFVSLPIGLLCIVAAFSTSPMLYSSNMGIFFCKFMTVFAVCLSSIIIYSPACIFSGGNGLKMVGVYTNYISAQMVQYQVMWNFSLDELKRETMCLNSFLRINMKKAVSFSSSTSRPIPTSFCLLDLFPKSGFCSTMRFEAMSQSPLALIFSALFFCHKHMNTMAKVEMETIFI